MTLVFKKTQFCELQLGEFKVRVRVLLYRYTHSQDDYLLDTPTGIILNKVPFTA